MPTTTLDEVPAACPPADASAAASGEPAAERTPLHRSPVALRVAVAGAVFALAAAWCAFLAFA